MPQLAKTGHWRRNPEQEKSVPPLWVFPIHPQANWRTSTRRRVRSLDHFGRLRPTAISGTECFNKP